MNNLYEVIGVSKNSTTEQINSASQNKLKEIKKMNVNSNEKKKLTNLVMEAFTTLTNYHRRRSYDEYLESQITPMNFFGKNPFTSDIFKNMRSSFDNFDKLPNNGFHKSYSSTVQDISTDNGSTIYKKTYSNLNGDVKETNQKITIDKDGNKNVEDLTKNNNKYNIKDLKNNHKIKYNI